MPPKCQPSAANPSQIVNPEASKPSSSLDVANAESTEPSMALLHQGSASGSLTLVNKPCLVGQSFHSPDGAEKSDQDLSLSLLAGTDANAQPQKWNFNPEMDPKKLKRLLANRVSAHKSRIKKQEYVEKLKKDIDTQEAKISELSPQVAFYEVQRSMLQEENEAMKQRLGMLEKQKAEKDAEFKKLKNERDMLALTYFLQQEGI